MEMRAKPVPATDTPICVITFALLLCMNLTTELIIDVSTTKPWTRSPATQLPVVAASALSAATTRPAITASHACLIFTATLV